MEITKENIEEQILLYIDGELDEAASANLLAYIALHEEYKPMLQAYEAVKIEPDEDVVFPHKELLLHTEPQIVAFKKTTVIRWAAAVAVLIGLSVVAGILFKSSDNIPDEKNKVAKKTAPQHNAIPQEMPATKDSVLVVAKTDEKKQNKTGTVPYNAVAVIKPVVTKNDVIEVPVRKKENIAPIQTVAANEIAVAVLPRHINTTMLDKPELPDAQPVKEELPEWVPIKEETLEGANDLIAHIQTLKENLLNKTISLKNATVVFRWGNKDLASEE